ncbi:hypothetical protein QQG55_40090 [Brugia pahangi]
MRWDGGFERMIARESQRSVAITRSLCIALEKRLHEVRCILGKGSFMVYVVTGWYKWLVTWSIHSHYHLIMEARGIYSAANIFVYCCTLCHKD